MQPASLAQLYVFNPQFGPEEENEDEKVLFYYPDNLRVGLQLREIGLTQAFINFSLQYKADRSCEFIHSQKLRRVIIQAEPDYWFVLIAKNPSFKKSKDEEVWREDELDDNLLVSVLQQSYEFFKFFYGPMHLIDPVDLRRNLKEFYTTFIPSLDIDKSDIFTTLNGIQYVQIEAALSLDVVSLANHLFDEIPEGELMIMFRDQLVYSALNPSITRLLNSYITKFILPGAPLSIPPRSLFSKQESGGSTTYVWPCIYVNAKRGFMTLVQRGDWIGLVVASGPFQNEAPNALRNLVIKGLPVLHEPILEQINTTLRINTVDETIKFVMFDNNNFELVTSNSMARVPFNKEAIKIISSNHSDFLRSGEKHQEMLVKTANDLWVFSKVVLGRELFVVIESKEPDLMAAKARFQSLCDRLFKKEMIL